MLFILLFLFFLDYLAFQPFLSIASSWQPIAQYLLYGGYWAISLFALGFILALANQRIERTSSFFSHTKTYLTGIYIAKFLLLFTLALLSLLTLFGKGIEALWGTALLATIPNNLGNYIAIGMGLFTFCLLIYGMLRNTYRYKLYQTTIPVNDLPPSLKGLKIIQISDIHAGTFNAVAPIQKAIDLINAQQADLVFFTGDIVNNIADELLPFVDIFSQIQAKYGVYSVLGNHDYGDYVRWSSAAHKQSNLNKLVGLHQKMGWDLLINEHRLLEINNQQVAVIGVENFSGNPRFPKYGDLAKAYKGSEQADLKLLLSHDPSHWTYEITKAFQDIAITFSGHTHGGQFGIEIGKWFKWSPVQYAYKEWAGLYQEEKQFLYVNRGFGVLGYPGRIGILPEITVVEVVNSF